MLNNQEHLKLNTLNNNDQLLLPWSLKFKSK